MVPICQCYVSMPLLPAIYIYFCFYYTAVYKFLCVLSWSVIYTIYGHIYTPLKFKCWAVTHRAAFMSTLAGLGVIGVSSGVVRMVYR